MQRELRGNFIAHFRYTSHLSDWVQIPKVIINETVPQLNEFLEEELAKILLSVIQRQQSLVYERSHEVNLELEVMIR